MSPVFDREDGYTFKIYSNEEERMHIHVVKAENTAKYWLEPEIELSENYGFDTKELKKIEKIVEKNADDFKNKYALHIGKRTDDK